MRHGRVGGGADSDPGVLLGVIRRNDRRNGHASTDFFAARLPGALAFFAGAAPTST